MSLSKAAWHKNMSWQLVTFCCLDSSHEFLDEITERVWWTCVKHQLTLSRYNHSLLYRAIAIKFTFFECIRTIWKWNFQRKKNINGTFSKNMSAFKCSSHRKSPNINGTSYFLDLHHLIQWWTTFFPETTYFVAKNVSATHSILGVGYLISNAA